MTDTRKPEDEGPLLGNDWDALRERTASRRQEIKTQKGNQIDWSQAGQRAETLRATLTGRGPRTRDRDMDFYAAALGLNMRLFRPFVLIGKLVNYAVAVSFLAGVSWGVYMLLEHQRMPVDFSSVNVVGGEARAGDKVDVSFDIYRHLVCQVNPDFAFIGTDLRGHPNHKWTFAAQHIDVGGPVGHDPFVRSFDLPKDMAPGLAHYRVSWSWVCPLNFVDLQFPRFATVPDAPFMVR